MYRFEQRRGHPGQGPGCRPANMSQAVITLPQELRLKQSEGFPRRLADEKVYYVYFLISSYSTSTKAPPMPLITLDQAPLKKAFPPSSFIIFLQQSIVPLYMMSAAEEKAQTVTHRAKRNSCVKARQTPNSSHAFSRRSPPLRPDCIIIRRLTVSKGYEIRPATAVTVWAIIQLTMMCVFLGSGSIPECGRWGKHVRVKMQRQTYQQGRARTGNVRAPLAVSKQPK